MKTSTKLFLVAALFFAPVWLMPQVAGDEFNFFLFGLALSIVGAAFGMAGLIEFLRERGLEQDPPVEPHEANATDVKASTRLLTAALLCLSVLTAGVYYGGLKTGANMLALTWAPLTVFFTLAALYTRYVESKGDKR